MGQCRANLSRGAARRLPHRGFTLMELLVVVGVVALLLGLMFPAFRSVRRSTDLAGELSLARQLMLGYRSYAYENGGVLMPGYYNPGSISGVDAPLPAYDENRTRLVGGAAYRYPWRIAPYLDYNLAGLYLDREILRRLSSDEFTDPNYLLSIYPSMGINGVFVGGDSDNYGFLPNHPSIPRSVRNLYVKRLSGARRPTALMVFVSARKNGQLAIPGMTMTEGFHKVTPPNRRPSDPSWSGTYQLNCVDPGCNTESFGDVSLRHPGLSAACGFFDGHTGTLSYAYDPDAPDGDPGHENNIRDMRHWADQADGFDWKLD
ncbi:MAG: prepilin-type N-terminal cleavage/methylation domain-containing protein [Planctomycetota bacterium]|jgi:prepilin-type N-terminal cleavage/methylation domain-containing protein